MMHQSTIPRYEADYWEYSHLCDLCHGTAGRYCVRNHMEDYFGHTGAFRCLVEVGTTLDKSLAYIYRGRKNGLYVVW